MDARTVFIIGDSLFAETLARTLATPGGVEVVGSAPTPEAALPLIKARCPDAVIVAGVGEVTPAAFAQLLASHPDLPLIRADLSASDVQVITSQRVGARSSDLLAAIAGLPRRSQP
jgi:DNA-binding NarL/FixJ family response regulator